MNSRLCLFEVSFKLLRRYDAKGEKQSSKTLDISFTSYFNNLLLIIALEIETTVFLDTPKDLREFHSSFDMPNLPESFL